MNRSILVALLAMILIISHLPINPTPVPASQFIIFAPRHRCCCREQGEGAEGHLSEQGPHKAAGIAAN